jgi:hypothetical protein
LGNNDDDDDDTTFQHKDGYNFKENYESRKKKGEISAK